MEIGNAGLPLVKDRAVEDRHAFDVEHDFRQPFGRLKELIGLEAADRGERVIRVALGYRDDVVGLRVELKFTLEKILENELVAELCNVRDPVDILGKQCPALQRKPIAIFGNVRTHSGGAIDFRIFVFQEVGPDSGPALLVRAEANVRIESERSAAAGW